jgi:hypothetical protein
VNITLDDWPNGRHTLELRPGPGIFRIPVTDHDLDDLAAFLAIRTAMAHTCPATHGEHTCTMPPGHVLFAHQCRACPAQWPDPGQPLPIGWPLDGAAP